MKTIKCLFPAKDDNWTGIPQPQIEGHECIRTTMVEIKGNYYEQFEFIK